MTKEYILEVLKNNKSFFEEKYDVEKIGLFGSYATGKATDESDIDIFVKLKKHTFRNVAGLWNFLEDVYNKKVDLFRENKRSSGAIYEHIKKETIFI